MKNRWNRTISTKLAFLIIVSITVLVIFFIARRALNIIEEIEQRTTQIQMRENAVLSEIKERR